MGIMNNVKRTEIWTGVMALFERGELTKREELLFEAVGKLVLIEDETQAQEALDALDKGLPAEIFQAYFGNPTASSVAKAPEQAE